MNNTLTLTIREPWFSMILLGIKKEEYRDIKPFYRSRFFLKVATNKNGRSLYRKKEFIYIMLKNGYRKNSRKLCLVNPNISVGYGKQKWGAEKGKKYYIIRWEVIVPWDIIR